MATKKVIDVNESSIVDLKAELFRKEQQFRQESGTHKAKTERSSTKKPPIWSKPAKPQSKSQSISQDNNYDSEPSEEEKSLQKSKEMLHAKAALYEKMAKGEIEDNEDDDNGGGRFLVDFHKKSYSEVAKQDDEESQDIGPPTPPPTCPEDEWVDYVDALGRSRRCLRKDLKQLQEMDKDIKPERSPSPPTLLSEDMRREMIRKKWEKEEEEAANRPVGPVHYQNVQFDEVRNLGVGYYQFSKVEEERQKQMETLTKLREETKEQRSRIEKVKDKRKAALEARLAKVRARKKLKSGEPLEDEESKTADDQKPEEDTEMPEKQEESLNTDNNLNKKSDDEEESKISDKKKIPEWAKHKIKQPDIVKSYVNQRRDERLQEFAPPSLYYDSNEDSNVHGTKGKRKSKRNPDRTEDQTHHDHFSEARAQEQISNVPHVQYPPCQPPVSNLAPPQLQQEQSFPNQPPPQLQQEHSFPNLAPPQLQQGQSFPNLAPPQLQQGQSFPNLPPPPVDFSQYPPPGAPPFQMPCYPPFPPPFNYTSVPPPNLPPPWQQLPGQQGPSSQLAFPWQQYPGQQEGTKLNEVAKDVEHQQQPYQQQQYQQQSWPQQHSQQQPWPQQQQQHQQQLNAQDDINKLGNTGSSSNSNQSEQFQANDSNQCVAKVSEDTNQTQSSADAMADFVASIRYQS